MPVALAKNLKHNKVIHNRTIMLTSHVEDIILRVPNLEKIQTEKLGGGFHRIRAYYGFMEDLTLESVLSLMRGQGLDLDPETASFYIGHDAMACEPLYFYVPKRIRCHLVSQSSS